MPKILPTIMEHDGNKYKDVYPHLKVYNPLWDLSSITLVHKLYNGNRIHYDNNGRIIAKEKIKQWGPYQFQCDGCGITRQTYEMILKHQHTCKKLVD
jgi:hypothetical protein